MKRIPKAQRSKYGCLEAFPDYNTVWFDGLPLNLHAMSRTSGVDPTYLSRIFRGIRQDVPIPVYRAIIKALSPVRKYTLDTILSTISEHKESLSKSNGKSSRRLKKIA